MDLSFTNSVVTVYEIEMTAWGMAGFARIENSQRLADKQLHISKASMEVATDDVLSNSHSKCNILWNLGALTVSKLTPSALRNCHINTLCLACQWQNSIACDHNDCRPTYVPWFTLGMGKMRHQICCLCYNMWSWPVHITWLMKNSTFAWLELTAIPVVWRKPRPCNKHRNNTK